MNQRVTLLREPPVVGQYYLVPTCRHPWFGRARDWPVFLPFHDDAENLNFPAKHYHIDPRFVSKSDWEFADFTEIRIGEDAMAAVQRHPLASHGSEHGPIIWKRRKCLRSEIPYRHSDKIALKLTPPFIGQQCRSSKTGWICPHKRVPLGSFAPVDGIITCPLHGLQINAETGKVVGPTSKGQDHA